MPDKIEVSIIIPCLNEEEFISECLDSILNSDFPKNKIEILVVDGLSKDRTREIVCRYVEAHPIIKMFDNPGIITSSAVNIGVKNSVGDIVVRMDSHSEYPRTYISDCIKLLDSTQAGNAGGRVITVPYGAGVWAVPVAIVTSNIFGVGGGAFRIGGKPGFVDTVPFGTFKREVFNKVGYFDEKLSRTEDNEFNARLRRAGYKIAFDPKITILYKNQATLSGLLHQAFYTGMWIVYALYRYPYTFQWRRFAPSAFVGYLVSLGVSFFLLPIHLFILLSSPFLLYLLTDLFISCSVPGSASVKYRVFVTFPSYHLAYGIGTFWGILNLVSGRWQQYVGKSAKK